MKLESMKSEREPVVQRRKSVKYPVKTTINLAKRESHSRDIITLTCGIALIAVLAVIVAKFGVIDQLARQQEAENLYNTTHAQYLEMQQAIADYPAVEQEYRTYSRKWMQDASSGLFVTVDRVDVLALLEDHLMPYGEVQNMIVQGETMVVSMSGMNLEQISSMFIKLQKQPIVESAVLNIASTVDKSAEASDLDFSITIILKPAEEESAS